MRSRIDFAASGLATAMVIARTVLLSTTCVHVMHAAGPLGDDVQPKKMRVTVALGAGTRVPPGNRYLRTLRVLVGEQDR